MLLVHATNIALVDTTFVDGIQRLLWLKVETDAFSDTDDMFKVEPLNFTIVPN